MSAESAGRYLLTGDQAFIKLSIHVRALLKQTMSIPKPQPRATGLVCRPPGEDVFQLFAGVISVHAGRPGATRKRKLPGPVSLPNRTIDPIRKISSMIGAQTLHSALQ